MKKYHIADILTLSRFFLVGALTYITVRHLSLGLALTIFIVGEITDALDGMFAKAFPYPDDGKFRFWRIEGVPKILDTGSDLLLGLTFVIYMGLYVDFIMISYCVTAAAAIGFFVSFIIYKPVFLDATEARLYVIHVRRFLYVVALFVLIARAILALNVSAIVKVIFFLAMFDVAYVIFLAKNNRLKER